MLISIITCVAMCCCGLMARSRPHTVGMNVLTTVACDMHVSQTLDDVHFKLIFCKITTFFPLK